MTSDVPPRVLGDIMWRHLEGQLDKHVAMQVREQLMDYLPWEVSDRVWRPAQEQLIEQVERLRLNEPGATP